MNFNQERFNYLIKLLYNKFGYGGPFHIVTDDGNLETRYIVYCLINYYHNDFYSEEEKAWLEANESNMVELMTMLLELPEDERYNIEWVI